MAEQASYIVSFDYNEFLQGFPAFVGKSTQMQAQMAFNIAETIINNTPASGIKDLEKRKMLLYILTAHIMQLAITASNPTSTSGTSSSSAVNGMNAGIVGRVERASRGEVDVEFADMDIPSREQWYTQTQYGFTYLQMIKPFMHARFGRAQVPRGRYAL